MVTGVMMDPDSHPVCLFIISHQMYARVLAYIAKQWPVTSQTKRGTIMEFACFEQSNNFSSLFA